MCSPPPNIKSGFYTPARLSYQNGSVVTYQCDEGEKMSGWSKLTCIDGFWNTHAPICGGKEFSKNSSSYCSFHLTWSLMLWLRIVGDDLLQPLSYCTPPPNVKFATLSPVKSSYSTQSVVVYSCYPGFTLLGGSASLTCIDGVWSGFTPYCQGKY